MIQAAILLLSALAIGLIAEGGRHARAGWLVGLAGQPFWLVATWQAGQWGMFALSIYYSAVYVHGWRRCAP